MWRNVGSGRDIIQPEKFEKHGNLETGDNISRNSTPKGTYDKRTLKKTGIYCEAEKRKNRKKKPINATQTGKDKASP